MVNRFAFSTAPRNGGGLLDPAETSVPLELGPGYAVVSLDVEGQPFRLMVDTAARSIIRFAPRVRDRLAGLRKLSERGSATRAAQLR